MTVQSKRSLFITAFVFSILLGVALFSFYTVALAPDAAVAERDERPDTFFVKLSEAALQRPRVKVRYDGAYVRIPYPMGDVPADQGVCTDEIVRIYRALGVDLQQLVHEDMKRSFASYPNQWGLSRPDPNIDHRRVPILMHFFEKFGETLPVSTDPSIYRPGNIVVWRLPNGLLHIGMVVSRRSPDGARPLIVHNIGAGPKLEDALFVGEIVGHFRF